MDIKLSINVKIYKKNIILASDDNNKIITPDKKNNISENGNLYDTETKTDSLSSDNSYNIISLQPEIECQSIDNKDKIISVINKEEDDDDIIVVDDKIDTRELLDIYNEKIDKINKGLRSRLEIYGLKEHFSGENITIDYLIKKSNKVLLDYLMYKIEKNIKMDMDIIEATRFVKENIIITFWIVYKFIINDYHFITSRDICEHIHEISSESNLVKRYKKRSYKHFIAKNILEREVDIIKSVNINSLINEKI